MKHFLVSVLTSRILSGPVRSEHLMCLLLQGHHVQKLTIILLLPEDPACFPECLDWWLKNEHAERKPLVALRKPLWEAYCTLLAAPQKMIQKGLAPRLPGLCSGRKVSQWCAPPPMPVLYLLVAMTTFHWKGRIMILVKKHTHQLPLAS